MSNILKGIINEGAYEDGVNDGKRGQANPRASSIYGPESNEYQRGYNAGLKQGEVEKQERVNQYKQEIAQYDDVSTDELKQMLRAVQKRMHERQAIYDRLRGSSLSFDAKKHLPPNHAEMAQQHKEDSKAWDTIHQVLFQRGIPSDQRLAEEQLDELSPDTLASYKKKAGAQASELDKAAWGGAPDAQDKINKANKRFSGIIRATKKELDNDVNGIKENAEELNMGDPVTVTGDVQFNGATGDIVGFSNDKHFVIVDLYNHGKRSFHSSDVSFNDYADSDDEHEHINRVAEDEEQAKDTDSILEYLTKAVRTLQDNKDSFSPEGWDRIKRSYNFMRSYLKDGDYEGFLSAYNESLRSHPDSAGLLIDEMFSAAGLDENATIDDFFAKVSEIKEGKMKDIAIGKQDHADMNPQQFNGQYGRTKSDWETQFSNLLNPKKKKKASAPKSTRALDYCPTCQRGDNRCVCESEQIDELKNSTLGSYVKKASSNAVTAGMKAGKELGKHGAEANKNEPGHEHHKVVNKREKGIDRALNRMMKQGVAEDMPPPENARKTQIAGTLPTYKKAADILNKTGVQGKALDFGAGLGMGTGELGKDAHSYEPFPNEKFKPHFVDVTKIPDNSYHKIVNLNVLNVVPNTGEHKIRDTIVKNIGRVLAPGGVALITTRGKDVLTIKGTPGEEPTSMISKIGTYQKGFTQKELLQYIQQTLGKGFEVSSIKLGPAGVMIKKLDQQGVAEGAPELLKQEMPLVRHIERELAQHGYEKGTPEYNEVFKHTISMYRKFGNVDAIKKGVAEGDNQFNRMMNKMTSSTALNTREAIAMMDELIHQAGANYSEALDQASMSYEIDKAKLDDLYQQHARGLAEDESKPVNMKRWLRDFERREDNNFHTENVLAMAQLVGTPEDVATMKKLVKLHRGFGLGEKEFAIRHAIADRLRPLVKQKIADSQAQNIEEEGPCWDNYNQIGMKPGKNGKPVPDCRGPVKETKSNILKGLM